MDWLFQLDGNILLFIQENIRQEWMNGFWKAVTFLGDSGWFWIVLSLILLLFKKTRYVGIAALLALLIGALVTNVTLKNLVARIRPYEVIEGLSILVQKPHDYSFPSGHACASFAAATVYYKMLQKRWGIPALILAALIAFSRLYVGVHYPSDVLAGTIVGVLAGWLACKIIQRVNRREIPLK